MQAETDPIVRRLRWLGGIVIVILVLWQFLPWIERSLIGMKAQPRPVTARGDLATDEQATIEIFEHASPSVVFISTRQRVLDYWTRNVFTVPRGTGSGFIWDDLGDVVTNNHRAAMRNSISITCCRRTAEPTSTFSSARAGHRSRAITTR